jgi:hypothetical protein
VHDLSAFLKNTHHQSFKHHIKKLQFGSHNYNSQKQKRTKASELINPLDGTEWGDEQSKFQ